VFTNNQFDIATWLISSFLLFIALLAFIPVLKTLIAVVFILASRIFQRRQVLLYKIGVKLLPGFLRATLGIGLAMTFVQPAHASTQSIVIDRIVEVEQVVDSRQGTSYIVQKGDSLWKIAERQLQDGNPSVRDIDVAWRELWEHNRDIIGDNPSLIYVGQKLSLP
jgi:hypothetical protein